MTLPTSAEFATRFPEFSQDGTGTLTVQVAALITSIIAAAGAEVSEAAWGESYTEGVMQLSAHKLALSPYSRSLQLVDVKGGTHYGEEFARMRRLHSPGVAVLGMRGPFP